MQLLLNKGDLRRQTLPQQAVVKEFTRCQYQMEDAGSDARMPKARRAQGRRAEQGKDGTAGGSVRQARARRMEAHATA